MKPALRNLNAPPCTSHTCRPPCSNENGGKLQRGFNKNLGTRIIVSAILGPVSTLILKTETNFIGAGMGTSGFVGQFATLDAMNYNLNAYLSIALLHIILPILLVLTLDTIFRKKGWIQLGDLKL